MSEEEYSTDPDFLYWKAFFDGDDGDGGGGTTIIDPSFNSYLPSDSTSVVSDGMSTCESLQSNSSDGQSVESQNDDTDQSNNGQEEKRMYTDFYFTSSQDEQPLSLTVYFEKAKERGTANRIFHATAILGKNLRYKMHQFTIKKLKKRLSKSGFKVKNKDQFSIEINGRKFKLVSKKRNDEPRLHNVIKNIDNKLMTEFTNTENYTDKAVLPKFNFEKLF